MQESCVSPSAAPSLVEHFFRREYGRLVALLTRRVGVRHIDVVEDAVQSALLAALANWTTRGLPQDPGAWLYRVAHNNLIGGVPQKSRSPPILEQVPVRLLTVGTSLNRPVSPERCATICCGCFRLLR